MPTITVPANSYAEVTDVEALVQSTVSFSTSTVPTLAQVQSQLINTFHEINPMLARAGYFVPVTVTGSQLTIGSQLQINAAVAVDDLEVELKDSGGSLTGEVMEADLFQISGDTQYYAAVESVLVGTDNLVTVPVTPPIRKAAAASTNVTHTATENAAKVLLNLHAHIVAAWAERRLSASGGTKKNAAAETLQEQADMLWKQIESGRRRLIGARRSLKRTPPGAIRLERRG